MSLAFARVRRDPGGPLRNDAGELPRLIVVPAERAFFSYACRAEEDDCVFNLFVLEMGQRPQILRKNTERARIRALQERLFPIGKWPAERVNIRARRRASIVGLRQTPILASTSARQPPRQGGLVKF